MQDMVNELINPLPQSSKNTTSAENNADMQTSIMPTSIDVDHISGANLNEVVSSYGTIRYSNGNVFEG